MYRGYVNTQEGQIHFLSDGQGRPVLLLHQTPISSAEYSRVVPLLSRENRVLAMDILGHGNSDVPPDAWGIEEYARNAWHFLDGLEIEKASVVGHHTGALMAVQMAVEHPERIDSIVLSGLPFWDEAERMACLADFQQMTPRFPSDGSIPTAYLDVWAMQRDFCLPGTSSEVWWPAFAAGWTMKERLHHCHVIACRYDVLGRLPLIDVPTLLLFHTRDHYTMKYVDLASTLVRNPQVRVLDNAGVLVALEMPELFAQAVQEFLDSNR